MCRWGECVSGDEPIKVKRYVSIFSLHQYLCSTNVCFFLFNVCYVFQFVMFSIRSASFVVPSTLSLLAIRRRWISPEISDRCQQHFGWFKCHSFRMNANEFELNWLGKPGIMLIMITIHMQKWNVENVYGGRLRYLTAWYVMLLLFFSSCAVFIQFDSH